MFFEINEGSDTSNKKKTEVNEKIEIVESVEKCLEIRQDLCQ